MTTTPTTWAAALAQAEARFAAAGIAEARVDAEWLLSHLVGVSRTLLRLHAARPLNPAQQTAWEALVRRRAAREPLAYVVGTQEFCGLTLRVDSRVLIPRWDTECLVEAVARELAAHPAPRLADLGTGSGAIALGLAALLPRARVDATDLDPDALAVAAANVAALGYGDRVTLHQGDLAAPLLPAGEGCYDGVVSNPPYVPRAVLAGLEPEVRDHEPRRALDGGADGLDLIRRLAPPVARLLRPGGVAVIECGDDQAAAVRTVFAERTALRCEGVVHDLGKRERGVRFRQVV